MITARAYSPSHITGFFKAFKNGSIGAGILLEKGMITKIKAHESKKNKITIFINGKKQNALTSKKVVKKFLEKTKKKLSIKVFHFTKIPIGYGLGISGAGALSLSIALNKALKTNYSKHQIVKIAKQAEIKARTGLGDVIAQQFHGIIVRQKFFPKTKIKKITCKKKNVVCGFFSPIKTKNIIQNQSQIKKINKFGAYCMKKILEKKTMQEFIYLSRFFAKKIGLASNQVKKAMQKIPQSSQSMLGNTVFVITNKPRQTKKELKKFCKNIIVSKIAVKGAKSL